MRGVVLSGGINVMDVKHLQKEKWNVTNVKLDVRDGKSEVGNEDFECSHPISHFKIYGI